MSIVIGIDPGVSGAYAVVSTGEIIVADRLPVIKNGKSSRINGTELAALLREYDDASMCWIERVGAMPGQGVSSTFTFGHSAGVVEGVVSALCIPVSLVTPQTWKKRAGLIGTDKDAARSRAIQLYPRQAQLFDKKGLGQAIADAVLIARFGGAA